MSGQWPRWFFMLKYTNTKKTWGTAENFTSFPPAAVWCMFEDPKY